MRGRRKGLNMWGVRTTFRKWKHTSYPMTQNNEKTSPQASCRNEITPERGKPPGFTTLRG